MDAPPLVVRSRFGDYPVDVVGRDDARLRAAFADARAAIVDARVLELHGHHECTFGRLGRTLVQRAEERAKSAETALDLCRQLVDGGFSRGDTVLAVGGGIIQDLATFAASILFRGVRWVFVPTTLLAQADSCIGGKSSLNLGSHKNLLGNFYPPRQVLVAPHFLRTLEEQDVRSGMGEIIKVHLISGPAMVDRLERDLRAASPDEVCAPELVARALRLKAHFIEVDELDTGPRLCMNYGHSFGHAIEAATDFAVPHGLAVTLGAKIANAVAGEMGRIRPSDVDRLAALLDGNLRPGDWRPLDQDLFFRALRRDKKNTAEHYRFVLLRSLGEAEVVSVEKSPSTDALIARALAQVSATHGR